MSVKHIYTICLTIVTAMAVTSSCNMDEVITAGPKIEDPRYRPATQTSSAMQTTVFEYTPAPGQFIGDTKTAQFDGNQTTPEAAAEFAQKRLAAKKLISLGGFGGYIVVGFDHSIVNTGEWDFAIIGNPLEASSEPGIVWVMQDSNGDGNPNDTWYELAGSEYNKAGTITDYSVTYFRPESDKMPIRWTDSEGASGEIDYLEAFHSQPSYFPAWIEGDSYTLTGTCLAPKSEDVNGDGTLWHQKPFDWGYADNYSPTDRNPDDRKSLVNANYFKISNAVDRNGQNVNLQFIDFVKVQTGVNTKGGTTGELSTEVFGFYDLMLQK